MKPLRLRARNLRTFPDLDITFDEGLVGILGELRDAPAGADSNGAGKSTILEAIDIALFGRRSLSGYLTRGGDVDELMIELTFEHDQAWWRVRRTFSARGRGKTVVDLERKILAPGAVGFEDSDWIPLTRASAKETDTVLCDLIGLSKETFRDSAYLRQGDGGYADPDRDPRQRKELLVEAVLGREPIWPRLEAAAKTRRKQAQVRLERIHGETGTLLQLAGDATAAEYEAKQAETALAEAIGRVEIAERELAAVSARYQTARDQAAKRQLLEAELAAAAAAHQQLIDQQNVADLAEDQARDLEPQVEALEQQAAKLPELLAAAEAAREERSAYDAAFTAARDATFRRNELLGRANELGEKAHVLRGEADLVVEHVGLDSNRCDRCEQLLGREAAERAAASYRAEADKLNSDAKEIEEQAKAIEIPAVPDPPTAAVVDPEPARRAGVEAARLRERLRTLRDQAATMPPTSALVDAARVRDEKQTALDDLEPVDLAALEREAATPGSVSRRPARSATRRSPRTRAPRSGSPRPGPPKRSSPSAPWRRPACRLTSTVTSSSSGATAATGTPALIIENSAIPYIETEASRILGLLGTSFQVELRTQAENKTGGCATRSRSS